MQDKTSLKVEIPVPWSSVPACIEAVGAKGVLAGVMVVIIIVIAVVFLA